MVHSMTHDSLPAPAGYHLQVLSIDVTQPRGEVRPIDPRRLRQFLGGSGLGTYLLLMDSAAEEDPLSPASPVVFAFSPLVSSPLTTSAKFAVVCRSPLTGRLNDALASSRFALAGKRCGCDAIVIRGQAAVPSVLLIDDGCVRLEPATGIWGLEVPAAENVLRDRFGSSFAYAVIGPAGEHLVRYATISHDGRHAGRGGSGAVLGSKRIKAIGVRGTQHVAWSDPDGLNAYAKELSHASFGPATAKYRELGTASNLLLFNRLNALPTRNFQQGHFESAAAIAPEALGVARERTRHACAACTIGCEHLYGIRGDPSGTGGTQDRVRLEYESLFALGPLCAVSDPELVLRAVRRCDALGLDTISAGGTLAFAMECCERGFLPDAELRFGQGTRLIDMLDAIAFRRGLGDALAEGSRRLAQSLGQGTLDFAPQVKGLEIPGYEPRALHAMALGFAVGTRGADHNRSSAYEADFSDRVDRRQGSDRSARLAVESEDRAALLDSMILCKFLRGTLPNLFADAADMLKLVTGWSVTADELQVTARRIVAAKKLFNLRAGWTPEEDTLPSRMLESPLPEDPSARLDRQRLNAMIEVYHAERGWTRDGYLPDELLQSLDLVDLARPVV